MSLPASALVLACLWLPPATAQAQAVQRCIGADGRAVYTDQKCEAIGATARLPSATAAEDRRLFRSGCPRVLSQLVGEIGAAIQGGDVNRLAGVYDWSGVSNASASRLMDRLEAMVARPLVDIVPVYPDSGAEGAPVATPLPPVTATTTGATAASRQTRARGPAGWMPSWKTGPGDHSGETPTDADTAAGGPASAATVPGDTPAGAAPLAQRPRPAALRIEQTLGNGATPARTVFALRRSYGCFWIAL